MKFLILFLFSLNTYAMSGSTYNPQSVGDFTKDKVQFNGQKISAIASAASDTNIDFVLADDYLITGASLKAAGACVDDEVKFQVVSGTTVVNQFIDWYVMDGVNKDLIYPAKIPATLKLRAVYKNTCASTTVKVLINYNLHKVLL